MLKSALRVVARTAERAHEIADRTVPRACRREYLTVFRRILSQSRDPSLHIFASNTPTNLQAFDMGVGYPAICPN